MSELDEETLAEDVPLMQLRYAVKALEVDIRGCIMQPDLAHCFKKSPLTPTNTTYFKEFVRPLA